MPYSGTWYFVFSDREPINGINKVVGVTVGIGVTQIQEVTVNKPLLPSDSGQIGRNNRILVLG